LLQPPLPHRATIPYSFGSRSRLGRLAPGDISVKQQPPATRPAQPAAGFVPVDIAARFNVSLADLHNLKYESPRPKGYSIMCRTNGRFGWDWNQVGYNKVVVDDKPSARVAAPSELPPACIHNSAGRPERGLRVDLGQLASRNVVPARRQGAELAILFIGVTNPMQSRVENGRFIVEYADGTAEDVILVNPSTSTTGSTPPFKRKTKRRTSMTSTTPPSSESPRPSKELKNLKVRAVANEVIIGVLGLSVCRQP